MDIIVLGAIIENKGKILIAKRKKGKFYEEKWEFPGGKLKKNETEQECLKREIKEEMNVDVEVYEYFAESKFQINNTNLLLKTYITELKTYNIRLNDHDEIAWVPAKELLTYDLTPADISIAKKLAERDAR